MLKKNMAAFAEPFDLLQIAHSQCIHIEPIVDENAIVISSKENGFVKLNVGISLHSCENENLQLGP